MKKISKEKQQQIIAAAVGAVAVCGLVWYFVITSQQKTLGDAKQKIQQAEEEIKKANALIAQREAKQNDLDAVQQKLGELEEGMASGDLFSWIILTGNKFKLGHKVELRYNRPDEIRVGLLPEFPYQAAKYPIVGSAYYHDLGKFVADFENKFPYFRLQNIELYPGDSSVSDDSEKLSFKFDIVALIKPATAAAKP